MTQELSPTKVVLAARSGGAADLLSPDLRAALRALGATRIQVNAPDPAFDAAMRIDELAPGVVGTVAVWGPLDPDAVLAAAGTGDWLAWEVEEAEPLVGPADPDGVRTSAMANLAFLRVPDSMDHQAWLTHWKGTHTIVAIDTQDTFGYVQNRVLRSLVPAGDKVAAIVEELFHEAAAGDPHVFYGSGGDDAELARRMSDLFASVNAFGAADNIDLVPTARYRWEF